jgi:fructose-1,6-bisphosphatase/inositol monophosphatase family enzyme
MGDMMPHARRINHSLGFVAVALGDADLGGFPGPTYPHDVVPAGHIVHQAEGAVQSLTGEAFNDIEWRVFPIQGVVLANNNELADEFVATLPAFS